MPTTQKTLKVCGRPNLLAPWGISQASTQSPATVALPTQASRLAPRDLQICTTSQLHDPGRNSVLGGHTVLETPRAGHPRWDLHRPNTDVAPGGTRHQLILPRLPAEPPSSCQRACSQVRAATHTGTLNTFSPRQGKALQVRDRKPRIKKKCFLLFLSKRP